MPPTAEQLPATPEEGFNRAAPEQNTAGGATKAKPLAVPEKSGGVKPVGFKKPAVRVRTKASFSKSKGKKGKKVTLKGPDTDGTVHEAFDANPPSRETRETTSTTKVRPEKGASNR